MAKAMLEAFQEEQNDPFIESVFVTKCKTCNQEVERSVESWEINDELLYIYDLTGFEYDTHFYGANISLTVCCDSCKNEFQEIVYVTGKPIWNDEEIADGRVPKVESFVGCEVKCLSVDEKDTSLQQCFKRENKNRDLIIIAKTKLNNGFCFLGMDESKLRIFRPIYTTQAGTCCWSSNYNISLKNKYTFIVPDHLNDGKTFTQYPHCSEDMVVLPDPVVLQEYSANIGSIRSIAKDDVVELFEHIKERKYVEEDTITPSAGIIRCSTNKIQINPQTERVDRCLLTLPSGDYDFPMKAIEYDDIINIDQNAYVVLGLARPFLPTSCEPPSRCYILVTGIHILDI